MFRLLIVLLLSALLLAGCRDEAPSPPAAEGEATTPIAEGEAAAPTAANVAPAATATAAPEPTATPLPPKDLVVCLGGEPADLYLYGDTGVEPESIRHALYEAPITSLAYGYQALALEKLPTPADGDVRIETVDVSEGQLVITADGELAPLGQGTTVIAADGQRVAYDGQPIPMNQLVVDYAFKPLVWSDGTAVTAEDSVFSFRVAGNRDTPTVDGRVRYTAAYEATGERSVRWTGRPGYHAPDYILSVWTPLPAHQLSGFTPAELTAAEETTRTPLGYGPFVVADWTPGVAIEMTPNPYYYRAAEGLPHLTSLTFRFIASGEGALPPDRAGCHILTHDLLFFNDLPALEEAVAAGEWVEHLAYTGIVEQILFGVDRAGVEAATPFADARVRQAIALCTDRQALVDEFTYGRAAVIDGFVAPDNPLLPDDLTQWLHDPTAGNALLDEAGYVDSNGDGFRDTLGTTSVITITLGTNSENTDRQVINERVRDHLSQCGLQIVPTTLEAGAWFAPGPAGEVFGRRFDLATFAWFHRLHPACDLYTTANIPGPAIEGYIGWEGVNVTGWSNEAYDAACATAQSLLPGQEGYDAAHAEAQRLFAQELPALPLFTRLRLAATTPDVLNFRLDPTERSELWNVFELDLATGGTTPP